MLKQAIIYNKNSNINNNKVLVFIVQGSIISIEKAKENNQKELNSWFKIGQKKITLQVPDGKEFTNITTKCQKNNLNYVLISSSGKNVTKHPKNENEYCILVIGPDYDKKIDQITNKLKLY